MLMRYESHVSEVNLRFCRYTNNAKNKDYHLLLDEELELVFVLNEVIFAILLVAAVVARPFHNDC